MQSMHVLARGVGYTYDTDQWFVDPEEIANWNW